MDYTRVSFFNDPAMNEAIVGWISETSFTMFEESSDGIIAYAPHDEFNEQKFKEFISGIPALQNIPYQVSLIKDQNWNREWESNFDPVLVNGRVYIRAPFHPEGNEYQYQVTIEPKMSFGTGHHATTALMLELMLQFDLQNKTVLDMGCGTAVLAIMAEKLGAKEVLAIDIDEWAYENSKENTERNNCKKITVQKGDINNIRNLKFDIILANINRNVLLSDMNSYVSALNAGGDLFLSGILLSDKEIVSSAATAAGLNYITEASRENWLALYFKKNDTQK
jgi:ribosomal protein L11 methyltransferase